MTGVQTCALPIYMGYMRQSAETIFAVFPLLAVGITPILGKVVDNKGKAATMLMFGSILLIVCHLTFAFILPLFKGSAIGDRKSTRLNSSHSSQSRMPSSA